MECGRLTAQWEASLDIPRPSSSRKDSPASWHAGGPWRAATLLHALEEHVLRGREGQPWVGLTQLGAELADCYIFTNWK